MLEKPLEQLTKSRSPGNPRSVPGRMLSVTYSRKQGIWKSLSRGVVVIDLSWLQEWSGLRKLTRKGTWMPFVYNSARTGHQRKVPSLHSSRKSDSCFSLAGFSLKVYWKKIWRNVCSPSFSTVMQRTIWKWVDMRLS